MKKNYIAITVDGNNFLGICGVKEQKKIKVVDAFTMPCSSDLAKDCTKFLECYSLEKEPIAIVYKCPNQCKLIPIPDLTVEEIKENLNWQIEEYIDGKKEDFFYDFMVMTHNASKYLYLVAMRKNDVQPLARGLQKGRGRLKIIDYWPAPILNLYESPLNAQLERISETEILVRIWFKGVVIVSKSCANTLVGLANTLEDIRTILTELDIRDALRLDLGAEFFSGVNGEDEENLACLLETFELSSKKQIEISEKARQVINRSELSWEVCLGLLIRGLTEQDG